MRPRPRHLLLLFVLLGPACRCAGPTSPLVQDFEGRAGLGQWPKEGPGSVTRSTDWKADGEASLRIDPGLLATIDSLRRNDFRGYDALQLHVHNSGDRLAVIGFELQDGHGSLHDRHQTAFGAPPGDSTVALDLEGELWRGEENRPYRGPTKTPIDLGDVERLGFSNHGDRPVYIDALTLVREPLEVPPGAFAFDFGKRGSRVMGKTTGVFEDSAYDQARGFGFASGKPSFLRNTMSYPSPLLGDGLAWEDAVFQVDLLGGPHVGWIAFERGGFWEEEATGYSETALVVNGTEADKHGFSPAGPHFFFEDVEVTSIAEVESRLVWPAHAVRRFAFDARAGANTFTLRTSARTGLPLRVAGLFLAPDTAAGRAFVDAHEARQKRAVQAAFPAGDQARKAAGATPVTQALVVEQRPVGEPAHPGDLPQSPAAAPRAIAAIAGHHAYVQLSLFAGRELDVTVTALPEAAASLPVPRVSRGFYGPKRPYSGGAAWIETHDYRPLAENEGVRVGPGSSRSLLLDFEVPKTMPPGRVTVAIRFTKGGELLAEVPLGLDVFAVDLPALPLPTGLFASALPFGPETTGEERWWQLQERLLAVEAEAGLNTPTGGPGLEFSMAQGGDGYTFAGERALRYLGLAKQYGLDRAVVCYSGFLPSIKRQRPDAARFQKSWADFEAQNGLPPHYVYAYDEPSTDEELAGVADYLAPFQAAGVRTMGFFSHAEGDRFRPVLDRTYAPAVNGHTPELLKGWLSAGKRIFLYNRGPGRLAMGSDLYEMIKLGVAGRLEWIGLHTQGFAFDDLDGREPSYGMFVIHDRLGVLPTPRWLSLREGLIDARIRLALQNAATAAGSQPVGWPAEYPADPVRWTDEMLDRARLASLRQLATSPGP